MQTSQRNNNNAQPAIGAAPYGSDIIITDQRRVHNYFPDEYLYSVQLDQEALKCYYCCATCPFCCTTEELAQRTWMDVYTSGIIIGRPWGWCCLVRPSRGTKVYFDEVQVFGKDAFKGTCCCSPSPYCCVDKCGCCGEALVMPGECTCRLCPGGSVGLGTECTTGSFVPCCVICLPISVMYGLTEGEATKVAGIINSQKAFYLSNGGGNPVAWHNATADAAAVREGIPTARLPLGGLVVASAMGQEMYGQPIANLNRSANKTEPYADNNATRNRSAAPADGAAVIVAPAGAPRGGQSVSSQQPPRAAFRLPEGDWRYDQDSSMYWSDEQQLYLRTTDGHFYDPHSTQWYNPDNGSWYAS